ncbi:glycosyl transferase [Fragilaria crotonensis]|nr:glycosyl transferase [Fragilaria crotonensis]
MESLKNKTVARRYDEIITGEMTNFNWTTTLDFPDLLSNQATAINVGMIFANIKYRFIELKISLDSLMLHRSCHVNFHFGVDPESREWVEAYFELRGFEATNVQFYSLEINDERIKNATQASEFGGGIAFMKINADHLFSPVNEMYLLDFDILVQRDICEAYSNLHEQLMKEDKMILIAGEMDKWYDRVSGVQKTIGVDLPADYRAFWTGINSGVLFLDLRQMRTRRWTEIWLNELQSGRYEISDYLALGEQSLINAIAQIKPEIFGFMPYTYNFQLNHFDDERPQVDLQLALFEYIYIFHGNNGKYRYGDIRSLAHVAWVLHNPMHTGTIPSFIQSGEVTIKNYKEKKQVIWWHIHKDVW